MSRSFWIRCLSSFFFLGHVRIAPGTFGSLAGAAIAWLAWGSVIPVAASLSVLCFFLCGPAARTYEKKDPQQFILDEVCGMLVAVAGLPQSPGTLAIGFILFRLFDIWKPWPIRSLDRMATPSAILWDDLAAGVAANLVLRAILA